MGLKPAYLPDNTIADIKEKIAKIMEPSSICQRVSFSMFKIES